jgi:hypothetical protein
MNLSRLAKTASNLGWRKYVPGRQGHLLVDNLIPFWVFLEETKKMIVGYKVSIMVQ